jgi:hypothetical protein
VVIRGCKSKDRQYNVGKKKENCKDEPILILFLIKERKKVYH